MNSIPLVLLLAAAAFVALVSVVVCALWRRRRSEDRAEQRGIVWRRAQHLAAALADGGKVDQHSAALREFVAGASDPLVAASALAVAVRQRHDGIDPAFFTAVNASGLADRLRRTLRTGAVNERIEILEIVEVLGLHALATDAALATRDEDEGVVRAACDAVVRLDPSLGLGILLALAGRNGAWVIDSIGRAIHAVDRHGNMPIPLERGRWRDVPHLARRAIGESAMFDRATVTDALGALIEALGDSSASRRLAAINALAITADDHPGAQMALAGALGSPDRMVRFAAASALVDTVAGNRILRATAAADDGSDASRIAAEILWGASVRTELAAS